MMKSERPTEKELSRRKFHGLALAALGGAVTGAMVGCAKAEDGRNGGAAANSAGSEVADGSGNAAEAGSDARDAGGDAAAADNGHDPQLLLEGKNVCRGLNHTCANHKEGDNKCAGQGNCATAAAHACHGENECKGEGGCGEHPGQNLCKGKGKCAVPLSDKAWTKARSAFEKAMSDAGKEFGPAPAKS